MREMTTFSRAIDNIEKKIIEMGKLVHLELTGIQNLLSGRKEHDYDVFELDVKVDKLDEDIHSEIIQLIIIQPPLPQELQALTAMMRVSRELERLGDQTVNIAEVYDHIEADVKTES